MTEDIDIPSGNRNSIVETSGEVPPTVVGGLDELVGDGEKLNPQGIVTRAELAEIIYRTYGAK